MNKSQSAALALARARLDPKHPGFNASSEVELYLTKIRYYLDAHVIPLIEFASKGETFQGQSDVIEYEREVMERRVQKRLQEIEDTRARLEEGRY